MASIPRRLSGTRRVRLPPLSWRVRCRRPTAPAWWRCAATALIALAGGGGMVSVAAGHEQVEELFPNGVAAFNGPSSTAVVAGEPQALEELLAECEARGFGLAGFRWTTPRTHPRSS